VKSPSFLAYVCTYWDFINQSLIIFLEPNTPANPWNYLAPILNYASYDCPNGTSCQDNVKLFETQFDFLPKLIFDKLDQASIL
jgi:hypothetical protein